MDKAIATQLANIEKKTGKTLAQLTKAVQSSGLTKHGEIRDMLKRELGLGHGDANTLVHVVLKSDGAGAAEGKSGDEGRPRHRPARSAAARRHVPVPREGHGRERSRRRAPRLDPPGVRRRRLACRLWCSGLGPVFLSAREASRTRRLTLPPVSPMSF